MKTFW